MEFPENKEERIEFQPGNTYFFICFALVCGGKSTFFEQIISVYYQLYLYEKEIPQLSIEKKYKMWYNNIIMYF